MDGLLTVGDRYIELCDKLLSLGYTKMGQNSEDTLFQLN
jgi:hypothetical protein